MLASINPKDLFVEFSTSSARLGDRPSVCRKLSDLRGCFADADAYASALSVGDPLLYEVSAVEPASGDGQLHYGLCIIHPGKIGAEYFLTKGHHHAHRPAAEIYIGLKGSGVMLLEDEISGESKMVSLRANSAVYVPGYTAHRTANTGNEPLVFLGIYPANAGHDYGAIAAKNFRMIIVERDGHPEMIKRNSQ